MKLHHISLRVKDMKKSLAFYESLAELETAKAFEANGGSVAYLQNAEGETMLELISMPGDTTFEGKGMFLCFAADSLEVCHERATALGYSPSPIRCPEPTAKYFYVYDPDGVSVQFREYK